MEYLLLIYEGEKRWEGLDKTEYDVLVTIMSVS